jgi:hypothetical protein
MTQWASRACVLEFTLLLAVSPALVAGQEDRTTATYQPGQPEYGNAPKLGLAFDAGRIGAALASSTSTSIRKVIAAGTTLRAEGDPDRPIVLVLYGFRVRDGSLISRYRSPTFSAPKGRTVLIPTSALPPERWFEGAGTPEKDGFLVANRFMTPDAAIRDPVPLILDGVFFVPDEWERREMVYLVAVPALDGSSKDPGSTLPVLVVAGGRTRTR